MSSVDINKLIQEFISNRPGEVGLVGVEEAGIPGYKDLLGKTYGRLGSAVKAPFKDQTPKPTQGPLKGKGAWETVKGAVSDHPYATAAIGAGALGAGYAAKKYLQRRKAKK